MTRALVVDDDPQIRRTLKINLTARGYTVRTAPDGTTALHAAAHETRRSCTPGRCAIDLAAKHVTRDGAVIRLTPTEWGILELLVSQRGKLVSQRQLLTEVWGPSYQAESHYLRVYLAQLRRKLEPDASHPQYLITEPGMGYRFRP